MEDRMTVDQAYAAMFDFIEQVFRRTDADVLRVLLSDMSLLPDGGPADPAVAVSWRGSVDRARRGEVGTAFELR